MKPERLIRRILGEGLLEEVQRFRVPLLPNEHASESLADLQAARGEFSHAPERTLRLIPALGPHQHLAQSGENCLVEGPDLGELAQVFGETRPFAFALAECDTCDQQVHVRRVDLAKRLDPGPQDPGRAAGGGADGSGNIFHDLPEPAEFVRPRQTPGCGGGRRRSEPSASGVYIHDFGSVEVKTVAGAGDRPAEFHEAVVVEVLDVFLDGPDDGTTGDTGGPVNSRRHGTVQGQEAEPEPVGS